MARTGVTRAWAGSASRRPSASIPARTWRRTGKAAPSRPTTTGSPTWPARCVLTAIHYPVPVHLQKAYESLGYGRGSFPHTEFAADRVISMPIFPEMTDEQVEYAASSLVAVTAPR